jgi:hypothetical protein
MLKDWMTWNVGAVPFMAVRCVGCACSAVHLARCTAAGSSPGSPAASLWRAAAPPLQAAESRAQPAESHQSGDTFPSFHCHGSGRA